MKEDKIPTSIGGELRQFRLGGSPISFQDKASGGLQRCADVLCHAKHDAHLTARMPVAFLKLFRTHRRKSGYQYERLFRSSRVSIFCEAFPKCEVLQIQTRLRSDMYLKNFNRHTPLNKRVRTSANVFRIKTSDYLCCFLKFSRNKYVHYSKL